MVVGDWRQVPSKAVLGETMTGPVFDGELAWHEEAFGEQPILEPWEDPFHVLDSDEPLEGGIENPEVCESCQ